MKSLIMATVSLSATLAHAGTPLLHCSFDDHAVASYCAVDPRELKPAQAYGEAEYTVAYNFKCGPENPGADLKIGVEYGPKGARLFTPFTLGHDSIVIVPSAEAVNLVDQTPAITYGVLFDSGCSLEIKSVTTSPSVGTLKLWQKDALQAKEAILDALDTWMLARNLDDIIQFDNDQLAHVTTSVQDIVSAMLPDVGLSWDQLIDPATGRFWSAATDGDKVPAALADLVVLHGDLPSLITLYDFSVDSLAGRPPVATPDDVRGAATVAKISAGVRYLGKLKLKIKAGDEIVKRARQHLDGLKDDLKVLADQIDADRLKYPVLR